MSSSYQVVIETTDQVGVVRIVGTLPPVMTDDDVMALGMAVVDAANAADRSSCVPGRAFVFCRWWSWGEHEHDSEAATWRPRKIKKMAKMQIIVRHTGGQARLFFCV